MKKILLMMLLLASMAGNAQERKYSTFYYQRATLFEELPVTSKDIIFLGNSITNGGEWSELLNISMSRIGESVVISVWVFMIGWMRF